MTITLNAEQVELLKKVLQENLKKVKKAKKALTEASTAIIDESRFIMVKTLSEMYCSEEAIMDSILSLIKSTNEK